LSDFSQGRADPMNFAGTYYVYILASGRHGTLYIGVCNILATGWRCIALGEAHSSSKSTA
jgi:hypothetical protein